MRTHRAWHILAFLVLTPGLLAQLGSGFGIEEAALVPDANVSAFGLNVDVDGDWLVAGENGSKVFVFERVGTDWLEWGQLSPPTGADGLFGNSVSVSGNTIAVGDNGHTGSVGFDDSGAVHVFTHDGTTWVFEDSIQAPDGYVGDRFGEDVSLHRDTLLAAAPDGALRAAYVFDRTGSTWTHTQKLTGTSIGFGTTVALHNDTALVGGDGVVTVFVRDRSVWSEQAVLTPPPPGGSLGLDDVALSGDTAVAAVGDDIAYVFAREQGTWALQDSLPAPQSNSAFGYRIDVADYVGMLVVGARHDDSVGSSAGAAHVYQRFAASWQLTMSLTASDAAAGDNLGISVGMSDDTVAAGAYFDDDPAGTFAQGSVRVFRLHPTWKKLDIGFAGVTGIPDLEGSGSLVAGTPGALDLRNAVPFSLTMLFVSFADTPVPFKGGTLHTIPIVFQLPVFTFLSGEWAVPWGSWPSGLPPGFEIYFQVAVADAAAANGVALSNLVRAVQP